jgi:hypothetical protein
MEHSSKRTCWAAIYPLMLAILVGLGWMDSTWYHGLQGRVPEQALDSAARNVADMLLWLLALALLAGGVAAWLLQGGARLLFVASMAVLCMELVLPAIASAVPGGRYYLAEIGPALRTGIHLTALALAALALRRELA